MCLIHSADEIVISPHEIVRFLLGGTTYTLGVQGPLNSHSLLEKTIILVRIYNQQFQGTMFLMVFDFQGK